MRREGGATRRANAGALRGQAAACQNACVPLAMTLKFALVGLGLLDVEADVRTLSRSGDRRELLRGPLLYGVVFVVATALWFRELPASVALLALFRFIV